MGREHLAVGINVYACTFRLFEQFFQVFQVMTADQDARVRTNADIDFRYFRITVALGIGFVEQGHSAYAVFSCFEYQLGELRNGEFLGRHIG